MIRRIKIVESKRKDIQIGNEAKLQKQIEEWLRDDGEGHHYPEFADRFKDFTLILDPKTYTASVCFATNEIRINPEFFNLPDEQKAIRQIVLLLRHEMAHSILMHQVRTVKYFKDKYGENNGTKMSNSETLHDLLNIIEDFEISNTRYSDRDKQTVKEMEVAGQIIGGLVTEEHRDWQKLSLIEMYMALSSEIADIEDKILSDWDYYTEHTADSTIWDSKTGNLKRDQIKYGYNKAVKVYRNTDGPTNFLCTLDDFLAGKGLYHYWPNDRMLNGAPFIVPVQNIPEEWVKIIKNINDVVSNSTLTKKDVKDMIENIWKSGLNKSCDITSPETGEVIATVLTPEEKLIAIDALKATLHTLEVYDSWVKKIKKELGNSDKYSQQDIQRILNEIM